MRRPLLPVIAAFGLFVAFGLVAGGWGAALPFLRARFDLGETGGGSVISAYNLGALVAILGCGLAERVLPPRLTVAALVSVYAGGLVCAGLAPSWPVVLIGAVVAGAGYGGLGLHLNTSFARGPRGVLMVNLLNAAYGVGAILGPMLVAVTAPVDVRWTLLSIAALIALCLPVMGSATSLPEHDGGGTVSALQLALPFAVVTFLYAGLETSAGAWISTHLTWIGTDPDAAARWASLFWAGLAVGRIVLPLVVTHPTRLILTGFATAVLGLLLATQPSLAVAGYIVTGLGLAPIIPTILAWVAGSTTRGGFANSIVLMSCMAGNVVYPGIMGAAVDPDSPVRIPLLLAGFAALGLIAAVWVARVRPARSESPAHPRTRTA
ncbi:MFS transporter [Actinokineospora enzanensis]|uniref:MFS transporter n=1 Tax=Actinokineospora enzanensis TaxID=155975 RepID=UPI00035F0901|nr:MFS transporter [Actinokineospora enzanensis]